MTLDILNIKENITTSSYPNDMRFKPYIATDLITPNAVNKSVLT
jgi:hypothetical protein